MRWILTLTTFLMIAGPGNADSADEGAKKAPSDNAIIDICGERLVKVFARFGTPEEIYPNSSQKAVLDFGAFGFAIKDKTVTTCIFFKGYWEGPVRGINFADTREQVVKVLGKTYEKVKDADTDAYGYELKEQDAQLWVHFKDDKVFRIQAELK